MEFGHHQRTLNDILFRFRTHFDNNGNANNVLSIFWEVRINLTLRWLDIVFQSQYLPSLSVNYVAINKDLEKLTPQLY